MNNNSNMIEISGLCKSFGEIKAVRDLSFSVREGELFAFLGVNGAGKSTTISIMCGQLRKDAGTVAIDGNDLDNKLESIKRSIGVVFQDSLLDRLMTVRENLVTRAALYGITGKAFNERLKELDALLGLSELLRRPIGKLSGGQRRRVDIARALLHRPRLLILDEPTTGLDPQTRKTVWEVIDSLRCETGMTVFLTTHYMEECAQADRVVILESGCIAAQGTPLELKNRFAGDRVVIYGAKPEQVAALGLPYTESEGVFRIELENTAAATALIIAHPEIFVDYEVTKGGMDDVFLAVTGRKPEGGEAR